MEPESSLLYSQAPAMFHIYNKTKIYIQINDKCTVRQNIIFNMLILKYTNTEQSPL